jgi:hypothetical protein
VSTKDRLARKTKQGVKSIVDFGWLIRIMKTMFINTAPSYTKPSPGSTDTEIVKRSLK